MHSERAEIWIAASCAAAVLAVTLLNLAVVAWYLLLC